MSDCISRDAVKNAMHDALIDDAAHMESVCERTAGRCDIWQDRAVYWMAVAILHILTWILRRGKDA